MRLVDIYLYLILFIVTVLTFREFQSYNRKQFDIRLVNYKSNDALAIILMLALTLLIGLRPISVIWQFGDSLWYNRSYNMLVGTRFYLDLSATNLIWDNLFAFFACNELGITSLFLLGDILYFGCTYLACRKLFPRDTNAAYLVFLGAFSTFSYSFNGVKAGIAASIFLLAIAYYEKKWLSIILVLISWGFHHSMQLPVAAYVLSLIIKNPRWYFYAWCFAVLIAVLHITAFQTIFANMTDETGQEYLTTTDGSGFGGAGGFRIDFLLYSAAPIFLGYKIIIKDRLSVSKMYKTIFNMYLCTNAVWCLCMYASYCNRIAYLSWFMYPIVLIYPLLKEDLSGCSLLKGRSQYKLFSKVMGYHLGFTLFMELVFYKLIK